MDRHAKQFSESKFSLLLRNMTLYLSNKIFAESFNIMSYELCAIPELL